MIWTNVEAKNFVQGGINVCWHSDVVSSLRFNVGKLGWQEKRSLVLIVDQCILAGMLHAACAPLKVTHEHLRKFLTYKTLFNVLLLLKIKSRSAAPLIIKTERWHIEEIGPDFLSYPFSALCLQITLFGLTITRLFSAWVLGKQVNKLNSVLPLEHWV